ncbi:Putative uncharacterized protein [Taphrina deformans PYCC 5710]|uniref:Vacuolar protein-sorting-associated protein 36 n=1 Tax=Taphrina deformans (strain PYCC 5710 / ATCC 11124 / CBS 356.35 / IMI 108563 / JCM 9778 / NBRC 8474) TaxID=1097556 RepID=R4XAX2_TAPDE|nr:Putative uncharacterized protein [Taphrina deformans PYCC 5710]|eukprot:CCG81473.1 Putative uncharacterized protein [Taphrina deformans PYCC 5710]
MLHSNSNVDERRDTVLSNAITNNVPDNTSCKLSFRAGGDKSFLEKLRKVLTDRAWTKEATTSISNLQISAGHFPALKGAGISALQNRGEDIRSKDADTMSGAFEDLEGLMARAKDMIALAESFASRVAANPAHASVVNAQSLIVESSLALGLSSAVVTKESFAQTKVYHAELARQIAEFLESGRLRQEGGCVTLVDLYAMYNRARKGDTISPEDLMMACHLFDELKLPVSIRQFKSGIIVVQDRGRSDESIRRLIVQWLSERTIGVTAIDAADRFGWSVGIAHQEFEMVEEAGDIVRDAGVEGLRFYNNIFHQFNHQKWAEKITQGP